MANTKSINPYGKSKDSEGKKTWVAKGKKRDTTNYNRPGIYPPGSLKDTTTFTDKKGKKYYADNFDS